MYCSLGEGHGAQMIKLWYCKHIVLYFLLNLLDLAESIGPFVEFLNTSKYKKTFSMLTKSSDPLNKIIVSLFA